MNTTTKFNLFPLSPAIRQINKLMRQRSARAGAQHSVPGSLATSRTGRASHGPYTSFGLLPSLMLSRHYQRIPTRNWPKVLRSLLLLVIVFCIVAFQQLPDAVAIVNNDPVPLTMFQQRIRLARWQTGQQLLQIMAQYGPGALTDPTSPYNAQYKLLNDNKTLGQQVLDGLITVKLIQNEANARGISVTDDEVQQQIDAFFGLGPSQATPDATETADLQANRDNYLGQAGVAAKMTQSDLMTVFSEQALQAKLYAVLTQDVPTQAEQIKVHHILVDSLDKANALLAQIKAGANFADVAKANSQDTTTNAQGGDLGWTPRGIYPQEFEDAIWNAKVGDVVGPVKTKLGYHLIWIEDRAVRPLSAADLARARNAAYQSWLNDAHAKSNIQIINNWLDFVPGDPTLADLGLPVK